MAQIFLLSLRSALSSSVPEKREQKKKEKEVRDL